MLHLVRYVSALEALFDQITIDLIAARGELVRRAPAREENEPNADNPVVLFGHPIESLRSAPTVGQGALMIPEVLRRLLGAHSNGVVANNPEMVIIATPSLQPLNPLQLIPTVRPEEKLRHPQGTPPWI